MKKFLIIFSLLVLIIPLTTNAFWPFSENKNNNTPEVKKAILENYTNQASELSPDNQLLAELKYQIFENGFEKKDTNTIMANKSNFQFTSSEINYLFNKESSKVKNPLLTNFKLIISDDVFKITADFKKFIKGRASFNAKLKNEDNKIKLKIEKLRIYGLPMPSFLASKPFNKALDDYFNFLYQDDRYRGFDISIDKDTVKINLQFTE